MNLTTRAGRFLRVAVVLAVVSMRDRGIRYGLQTICEAGATANASLVELID